MLDAQGTGDLTLGRASEGADFADQEFAEQFAGAACGAPARAAGAGASNQFVECLGRDNNLVSYLVSYLFFFGLIFARWRS